MAWPSPYYTAHHIRQPPHLPHNADQPPQHGARHAVGALTCGYQRCPQLGGKAEQRIKLDVAVAGQVRVGCQAARTLGQEVFKNLGMAASWKSVFQQVALLPVRCMQGNSAEQVQAHGHIGCETLEQRGPAH